MSNTDIAFLYRPAAFTGRLMRLRTCHDVFMVQCEPCEVIHIVNASYAATRLQHRNPIHGCSDLTFQQEFDCLLSAKAQYFEAITRSCDGIQTCQFAREGSFVSCGHSSKTWSCCMEIYYTCEPSKWKYKNNYPSFRGADAELKDRP